LIKKVRNLKEEIEEKSGVLKSCTCWLARRIYEVEKKRRNNSG